jgi:hypothetical protein
LTFAELLLNANALENYLGNVDKTKKPIFFWTLAERMRALLVYDLKRCEFPRASAKEMSAYIKTESIVYEAWQKNEMKNVDEFILAAALRKAIREKHALPECFGFTPVIVDGTCETCQAREGCLMMASALCGTSFGPARKRK